MKIVKLFLVAAIALGMAACNNDVPEVQGEAGMLTVKVVATSDNGTRLSGDVSGDIAAESTIHKYEVWVFNTNGNLEKYHAQADGSNAKILGLTKGDKEVVVVANGNIGSQPNKATLLAKTNVLSQDLTNGLLMTMEPQAITLTECNDEYTDCNTLAAAVKRVNARVALVNVTTEFDALAPYQRFDLEEVAMFNVRETSNIFGASLINATSEFLYGSQYPSHLGSYVGYNDDPAAPTASLLETLSPALNVTATPLVNTNAKYFYVHENDATVKQETFIVLKGKLYDGEGNLYTLPGVYTGDGDYTYYKVYVNANLPGYSYDDGYTADGKIIRNTQYNISINIKKAGTPDIDPTPEACLDVTIEVVNWAVVNQSVVW